MNISNIWDSAVYAFAVYVSVANDAFVHLSYLEQTTDEFSLVRTRVYYFY